MGRQIDVPALGVKERVAVVPGRMIRSASPGQCLVGWDKVEVHLPLGAQGIEIVEIGDARQNGDRDPDPPVPVGGAPQPWCLSPATPEPRSARAP